MLKETILSKSLTSHALDEDELIQLRNETVTNLDDSASLPTAGVQHLGQSYFIKGIHYVCELVESVPTWVTYDTSGQSLHYPDASGKPTLDGITLNGAMAKADLGIASDNTARTEKTTLESTDKIPINDDKYTTIGDIAVQTDSVPLFIDLYSKLYLKNDNTLTVTKSTNDVTFALTNEVYTTQIFEFTIDTLCKLRSKDSIYGIMELSGVAYQETHNINFILYKNNVQIATSNNLHYQYINSGHVIGQYKFSATTDLIFEIGDILKVSISINEVGLSGTENVLIQNGVREYSFLSFKEEISNFIPLKNYGQASALYYVYNNDKKQLNKIIHTAASNAVIYMDASPQSTQWDYLTDNDQEILLYNLSGATRNISLTTSLLFFILSGTYVLSVDSGKALYVRFQYIELGGTPTILFKDAKVLG